MCIRDRFATVGIAMGEPFDVPRDADEGAIERARLFLERRLEELAERALQLVQR